jgi:hypothetical protein
MTNPVPVDPLPPDFAEIETTDGITRFAISATEPGGRSIDDVTDESLIECPKSEPDDEAPMTPPMRPAITARIIALPRVMLEVLFLPDAGIHHGPEECKSLIYVSSYN